MSQQGEFFEKVIEDAPQTDVIRAVGAPPVKPARTHPMAVGLKEAKQLIALVLEDVDNLRALGKAFQVEFDDNPTRFLRMYEPLLRGYESSDKGVVEERGTIRISGPTIIMTDGTVRDGLSKPEEVEDGG